MKSITNQMFKYHTNRYDCRREGNMIPPYDTAMRFHNGLNLSTEDKCVALAMVTRMVRGHWLGWGIQDLKEALYRLQ